ncbi:hypothetical protein IWX90DRAFT_312385 [Phyllosticta citrichinensis]|uniref:GST N-terminal domain-containing protein n=1 Tax=Phyllosticta citrichinensis TaxID=1130410 RepID=A0ABR1XM25_9PEZI
MGALCFLLDVVLCPVTDLLKRKPQQNDCTWESSILELTYSNTSQEKQTKPTAPRARTPTRHESHSTTKSHVDTTTTNIGCPHPTSTTSGQPLHYTLITRSPFSPATRKVLIALEEIRLPYSIRTDVPWTAPGSAPTIPTSLIAPPPSPSPSSSSTSCTLCPAPPATTLALLIPPAGLTNAMPIHEFRPILMHLEAAHRRASADAVGDAPPITLAPPLAATRPEDVRWERHIETLADGVIDTLMMLAYADACPQVSDASDMGKDAHQRSWQHKMWRKVNEGLRRLEAVVREVGADGEKTFLGGEGGALGVADLVVGVLGGSLDAWGQGDIVVGGEGVKLLQGWRTRFPHLGSFVGGLDQRESFKKTKTLRVEVQLEGEAASKEQGARLAESGGS